MEQKYLYIILVVALLAIVGLVVALYRCRRRLHQCQRAMVRCINENIEMKEKLPEYELPNFLNREDVSPEEFTRIIHNMLKRLMFLSVFLLIMARPVVAQEKTDSTFTFRFIPDRDMFFVPYGGNDAELTRLMLCVEQYKADILSGGIPLRVDGYSSSGRDEAENLAMSKTRSNRVKSELITRQQLTEECFITQNHSGGGDYVTVKMTVPIEKVSELNSSGVETRHDDETDQMGAGQDYLVAEERSKSSGQDSIKIKTEQNIADDMANAEPELIDVGADELQGSHDISIRANLLRWATLTPDLGIEWRINRSWDILVNSSWTSWSWSDKDRRYALWEVSPEVRYYMGKEKRGYIGAIYKAGAFNYKLSATGRQGDLMGGGISGGYQLRLNNALSLDFNLAVGCLHADYEKYQVIDGVRVWQGKESKNCWGPVNAAVTLVWRIFQK